MHFNYREYLTGFRKRNLARKIKAKQNLDKKLKEEMKRIKHNVSHSVLIHFFLSLSWLNFLIYLIIIRF